MKYKDDKIIADLYESIYKQDYLQLEESNLEFFNWDEFFKSDHMSTYGSMFLLEDFELIETRPKIDGEEDIYKITLRNGKEFKLFINYIKPDNAREFILKNSESANLKNNNELADNYTKYFPEDDYQNIVMMQFSDSDGRHELTGDVGFSTPELFSTLKSAFFESVKKVGGLSILQAIIMRVSKKETRRLTVYRKLMERYLKDFPNIFEDGFNEEEYVLLIATK
jgi:hypothetical protein